MTQLQHILSEVADEGPILSIQPGGNYGDHLIYRGFNKLISHIDVKNIPFAEGKGRYDRPPELPSGNIIDYLDWISTHYQYIRNRFAHDISAVYIHGGGNFNDLWKGGIDCYKAADRYFSCPIIIGPQSCLFEETNPKSLFQGSDNETYFFCREEYSHEIIKQATMGLDHVSAYLSQDTAFYLDKREIPFDNLDQEYSLLAMRADKESSKPKIQYDIESPLLVQDISTTATSFKDWVNIVAKANIIYTDRLHVAILASILDKPLIWYEASYHKSRGVYEYSLIRRDNIEFQYIQD